MKSKEEIEQLAEKEYPLKVVSVMEGYKDANRFERVAYKKGYTQCQEDMADKKYTEEDMIKFAIHYRNNVSGGSLIRNMLSDFTLNKQD